MTARSNTRVETGVKVRVPRVNGVAGAGRAILCLVVAMLVATGCSRSNEWTQTRPPTYAVSGVVTYRGEPVLDGLVVFLTNPSHEKWTYGEVSAFGVTDAQGRFRLRTFRPGDGAVAGRHTVLIQKVSLKQRNGKPVTQADLEGSEDGSRKAIDPASLVEAHHLPERYRLRDQTPFSAEVMAGGSNEFRFALD